MSPCWIQGENAVEPALYGYPNIKCERQVLFMSYESFKAKINALIKRSGQKVSVRFSTDEEKGKHYANCSDGTTIIGCPCSLKVTVKWGSGHTSMATI